MQFGSAIPEMPRESRFKSTGETGVWESDDREKTRKSGFLSAFADPYAKLVLIAVCSFVVYYLTANLSLGLRYPNTRLSPVWFPNSILLASLLLSPPRIWWVYLVSFIPAHLIVTGPYLTTWWFVLVQISYNVILVLTSASLVNRFSRKAAPFETLGYALIFTILGVVTAVTFTQFLVSGFVRLVLSDLLHLRTVWDGHFWLSGRRMLLSNLVPFLIVTPAIILWVRNGRRWLRKARPINYVEVCFLGLGLIAAGSLMFSSTGSEPARLYAPLPFFIWAAVRFGPGGVSTSLVTTVIVLAWQAIHGRGPLTYQLQDDEIFGVQIFLIAMSGPMLFLASLVEERKQTERALRRNEERLNLALTAGHMGTWDWKIPDGKITWLNETGPIVGCPSQDFNGNLESLSDLAISDDRAIISFSVARAVETGLPLDVEFRTPCPGGGVCWVLCKGMAQYDETGLLNRMLGVAVDVTERKNLEEALRRREREFSALVENSPDVIFRLDRGLRYTYISPVIERYTGIRPEGFLGKTVREIPVPGYDREGLVQRCLEAINQSREVQREYSLATRHYRTRIIPEFSPSGVIETLLGITEDITERKIARDALLQSEKELRASRDQVRELARKLLVAQEEERQHISRELHDDLNQRVAALAIFVSNIKRQLTPPENPAIQQLNNVQERVAVIAEEIRRLSHRLRPASLDVGLAVALKSLVGEFSDHQGVTIGLSLPVSSEEVSDDIALCLYRVAQESLHNVAKHSGAKHANIDLTVDADRVRLTIKDDGRGFEHAAPGSRKGLGLLSMEERVRLLQGNFKISTVPGIGTSIFAEFKLNR